MPSPGRREDLIRPLRHYKERIMRRSNLILLKFLLKKESKKMRSSRLLKKKPQDDCLKAHPPESPSIGEFIFEQFSSLEECRFAEGGCLYLFVSSFFTRSILFKIFFHATLWNQLRMKTQDSTCS